MRSPGINSTHQHCTFIAMTNPASAHCDELKCSPCLDVLSSPTKSFFCPRLSLRVTHTIDCAVIGYDKTQKVSKALFTFNALDGFGNYKSDIS